MLPLAGPSWCQCSQGYISNYVWPSRHGKKWSSTEFSRLGQQASKAADCCCCKPLLQGCILLCVPVSVCECLYTYYLRTCPVLMIPCSLWPVEDQGRGTGICPCCYSGLISWCELQPTGNCDNQPATQVLCGLTVWLALPARRAQLPRQPSQYHMNKHPDLLLSAGFCIVHNLKPPC